MAKELPYFKYFPSEWVTGDITLCSMETQGLFTNLCAYYWMKNCSMSLANAKQRFNKHKANITELLEFGIIKTDENENVIINFLDKQMNEFVDVAEKRALAGAKGGKAKAKQLLSKTKAKHSNKEIDKEIDKDIYIRFAHLKITKNENQKLIDLGYTQEQIDTTYLKIENHRKNTNYKSLYLTSIDWLKRGYQIKENTSHKLDTSKLK